MCCCDSIVYSSEKEGKETFLTDLRHKEKYTFKNKAAASTWNPIYSELFTDNMQQKE